MGEPIEELIETLRKKADIHLVAYQVEASNTYRATAYFWPGSGNQIECRVQGADLRDVLVRLDQAVEKAKDEAA
jgi:hypothetical protein